mmetsp:Transcript_42694/g.117821  ORF Transcript_42694/g.117821 Transcript_42694/m.117821 type:complete len:518 (-) Transcript_42694:68-1621(-)
MLGAFSAWLERTALGVGDGSCSTDSCAFCFAHSDGTGLPLAVAVEVIQPTPVIRVPRSTEVSTSPVGAPLVAESATLGADTRGDGGVFALHDGRSEVVCAGGVPVPRESRAEQATEGPPPGPEQSDSVKTYEAVTASDRARSRRCQTCLPRVSTSLSSLRSPNFETFPAELKMRLLPIVVFTDDMRQQRVWRCGTIEHGKVLSVRGQPDLCVTDPVVMSPAHLGFKIEPHEHRYLHYKGIGVVFARPLGARFMQPSIDTLLVCQALGSLFEKAVPFVRRAIDVGSGSGFIGKFVAVKAPGRGNLSVTLCDIDNAALCYCRSPGFNAPTHGRGRRAVSWHYEGGDAIRFLDDDTSFDLVVSNPPYVPTLEEVQRDVVSIVESGFWEGVGLVVHLVELMLQGRCNRCARLVLMVTSLTFKAVRVRSILDAACAAGVQVRILAEREIAWKAWYAGRGAIGNDYLLAADPEERCVRRRIGGCEFYVGATEPRSKRMGNEGAHVGSGYHWQVAYVLDIHRPT